VLRWSDELRIGFCADRLVCARLGRGFGPRVTDKRIVAVSEAAGQPLWKNPLRVFAGTLKDMQVKQASVVLSSRFVRYTVVPWHDELMKRGERLVQARHCFKQIYGDAADKWSISLSEGGYGAPVLATGVDQGLIEGLRSASRDAGVELASTTPYLTTAYNQFRTDINGTGCFSIVEQDDIGILHFDALGLRSVFNQRIHEDWAQELRGMLAQNASDGPAGAGAQPIRVFAPGRSQDALKALGAAAAPLSLPARRGYSPVSDAAISMAMAGAG
jgi:hypothetical protein